MSDIIGPSHQLIIVAEIATIGAAHAGIERHIADRLLMAKRRALIGRFSDKIFHLDIFGIMAIVIPTNIDTSMRIGRRPGKEMGLEIIGGIIIDAGEGGSRGSKIDTEKIDARGSIGEANIHFVRGK